jgi:uncharacterized protein (TIGR02996 family)
LLAEIIADPASTTARLVYADHLIELGDPRGELIQAQCQFEKIEWDDPQRRAIDERIADLLATHETEWTRDVRALGFDDHLQQVTLRRGFVEKVTMDAKDAARVVPQLRAITPLRELHVSTKNEAHLDEAGRVGVELELLSFRATTAGISRAVAQRLPHWPIGPKLSTLHVHGPEVANAIASTPALSTLRRLRVAAIQPKGMAQLASAEHLDGVHTLELPHNSMGIDGLVALARGKLTGLRRLQIEGAQLPGTALRPLGQATFAPLLVQLRAHHNKLALAGARTLAEYFPALELLDVEDTELRADGARAILSSTKLPALRSLDLSRNALGDELAGAIDAIEIPALRHLAVLHALIGTNAVAAIARCPRFDELRSLDLSNNPLGDDGVIALVESARLPRLDVLRIKHTGIGVRGLTALGASALGTRLRAIDVAHNAVDDNGLIALLAHAASFEMLESLDLGSSALTIRGIQALVASPLAPRLKHLTIAGLSSGALDPLLAADLPQLRSLVADRFDDDAARLLAGARGLPNLHSIVFTARELTDVGARALADSPNLQRVLWLELGAPAVTDIGRAALRRRFGHHVAILSGGSLYAFGALGRRI